MGSFEHYRNLAEHQARTLEERRGDLERFLSMSVEETIIITTEFYTPGQHRRPWYNERRKDIRAAFEFIHSHRQRRGWRPWCKRHLGYDGPCGKPLPCPDHSKRSRRKGAK